MKNTRVVIGLPLFLGILGALLFLFFQARGIYGGDSGDLVTAAYQMGIPHPPGYPLYTFLSWLLTHLPFFTVAWRVGILSSLPHGAVVSLLYLLVFRLTKRRMVALFSALALFGNYLFFLYAVTPEVFALFDLFLILLVYLLIAWRRTKHTKYLAWASFVFGLSLTHHHVMLFFVPAIIYWVWINKKLLFFSFHSLIHLSVYFFIGLLPYLYIPVAARGSAIINWDRPVDVSGFVRLVTRADYGTFVSGGFYGAHPVERLLQIQGYFQLLLVDLTWVGVIFILSGCIWLWRHDRQLLYFFVIALFFLGPAFFFYASFPLFNRFNWGTYERFLLPSYMFLYIILGVGFYQVLTWIDRLFSKRWFLWKNAGRYACALVFFVYPVSMAGVTLWRFVGLPQDQTAQNLGVDLLESVPSGSIVLVSRDTPLFTSQYVRYAQGVRSDVVLLHANKLSLSDYQKVIAGNFPFLKIPEATGSQFSTEFIKVNAGKFPIFTNTLFPLERGWFWVPHGLLYQLTPETSLPSMDIFYRDNRLVWDRLHDPANGILARYNHLMLSDVRDVYASARIEFGKTLLKAGKLDQAKEELTKALAYGGDTQVSDAYLLIGLSELFAKHCNEAIDAFAKARAASIILAKELPLYEAVTYRDCTNDQVKAKDLFDEYEKLRQKEEIPLR